MGTQSLKELRELETRILLMQDKVNDFMSSYSMKDCEVRREAKNLRDAIKERKESIQLRIQEDEEHIAFQLTLPESERDSLD